MSDLVLRGGSVHSRLSAPSSSARGGGSLEVSPSTDDTEVTALTATPAAAGVPRVAPVQLQVPVPAASCGAQLLGLGGGAAAAAELAGPVRAAPGVGRQPRLLPPLPQHRQVTAGLSQFCPTFTS